MYIYIIIYIYVLLQIYITEMGISHFCFQAPGTSGSQLPGRRLTTERSCRSYWPFPRHGLGLGRACYPSDTRDGARILMNSMKQPDTSRITTQSPQIGGFFSPGESSIFQPRPQPMSHDLPRGETRSQAASKLKVPELVALKSLVAAGRGWRFVCLGVQK